MEERIVHSSLQSMNNLYIDEMTEFSMQRKTLRHD